MNARTSGEFDLSAYIMHHVQNGHEWNIPFLPAVKLPAILSLHGLMILIWAGLLTILVLSTVRQIPKVPQGFGNLLELFVLFIRDHMARPFLGDEDGRRLTPLLCTFFVFILGLNLMGLVPLFATATANINVTGSLAVITLSFMIFGAVYKNGPVGFLRAFIPHGVPWPILILLVPLEFLGMFIKAFALMIRLFANMLAGHIVIFALLGLVVILGLVALPAVILAVFIAFLEVLVAFLQTYIFTLLSAMFIGQTMHPQH